MNRFRVALYVLRGKSVIYGGKTRIKILTDNCAIESYDGLVDGVDISLGDSAVIKELVAAARAEETGRIAEAIAHGEKSVKRRWVTYISGIDPPNVVIDGNLMLDRER